MFSLITLRSGGRLSKGIDGCNLPGGSDRREQQAETSRDKRNLHETERDGLEVTRWSIESSVRTMRPLATGSHSSFIMPHSWGFGQGDRPLSPRSPADAMVTRPESAILRSGGLTAPKACEPLSFDTAAGVF
jgi:hypothetical protein